MIRYLFSLFLVYHLLFINSISVMLILLFDLSQVAVCAQILSTVYFLHDLTSIGTDLITSFPGVVYCWNLRFSWNELSSFHSVLPVLKNDMLHLSFFNGQLA